MTHSFALRAVPAGPTRPCATTPRHRAWLFGTLCLASALVLGQAWGLAQAQVATNPTPSSGGAVSGTGPVSGGGPVSGSRPASPDRALSGFENQGVSGIRPNPADPAAKADGKEGGKAGTKDGKDRKADAGKAGKDFTGGLSCANCGTLLQVRSIRMRPQPSWMSSAERRPVESGIGTEAPTRGHGTSVGTTGVRPMIGGEDGEMQFGKRVFEVTLLMDNGQTQKFHMDWMPAYNIGSKVRVVGNRLMPR